MRQRAVVALGLSVLVTATSAQQSSMAERAAATVAHLHDSMLDPASFVLDGVYVTKPSKRGNVSVCYMFRSHNAMGGYSVGRAVEDGDDHNRLSVYTQDNGAGGFPGYDVGWIAPCKAQKIGQEITASVRPLIGPLYQKGH